MSWRRIRALLRPPRRLRVLRAGTFVIAGTLALGFATLNTGNNLLYLLLGALLGLISLSGWMSEQVLRGLRITRVAQSGIAAGSTGRFVYIVEKERSWLPTHDVEIREAAAPEDAARPDGPAYVVVEPGWVMSLASGDVTRVRSAFDARTRGIHDLPRITLATTFPFGLFRKERDIELPGALIVWPRPDRVVRAPAPSAARGRRQLAGAAAAAARTRGDYRGLRAYRSGDDRRDIHWRSSARLGQPVVREYEQEAADEYWIVIDTGAPDHASGEAVVETAAALVLRAARNGDRSGLAADDLRIEPGHGPGRVEALLDVLAGIVMRPGAPRPHLPAAAESCVLVTARTAGAMPWGDIFRVDGADG